MQLDDVIAATSPDAARMEQAMRRSIRWLDRCIKAHQHPDRQSLFCIIQGGLDLNMRRTCCEEMLKRDTPGIAIGGLSGGEAKDMYCQVSVTSDDISAIGLNWLQGRHLYRHVSRQQATIRHGRGQFRPNISMAADSEGWC